MNVPSIYSHLTLKEEPSSLETQPELGGEEELYDQPQYWNGIFGQYNFEELIAETESSLVWIGMRLGGNSRVALKITENIQNVSSQNTHQQKQRAFVEEYRLSRMVGIKQFKLERGYQLLVMDYYPWSLEEFSKHFRSSSNRRYTQFHFQFIVYAFVQILKAVNELHELGYVHRDLKLDNFMVDSEFNVYLNDFELVTKELEVDSSLSGTLEYMAPQRLSNKRKTEPITKAIDIWSLGIILYELHTGNTPYNGESAQEILDQMYQIYAYNEQIPSEMMSLIQGMLQIKPENRLSLFEIQNHKALQMEVNISLLKGLINE